MGKHDKLLVKILRGSADADIAFDELCSLLRRLGFEERARGGHHIFRKAGIIGEDEPAKRRRTCQTLSGTASPLSAHS